jgi:hypothetical protein
VWKESNKRIINNGCVMPMASHFNQANLSGKKHSSQSSPPVLFAPRAAHQHDSLFIIIHWQHRTIPALRLKHRSGGCGTASALPKCSIIHKVLSALLA